MVRTDPQQHLGTWEDAVASIKLGAIPMLGFEPAVCRIALQADQPLDQLTPNKQLNPPTFEPVKAICIFILYDNLVLLFKGEKTH